MKPNITLIVLTHDQVDSVRALLERAHPYVDQVLIWDDFSHDKIANLAASFKADFHQHALKNDFAAHRNAALRHAKGEWTVFLDGDEQATSAWWEELQKVILSNDIDAVFTHRRDWFLGRWLKYGETRDVCLLRVARTSLGKNRWERPVHEVWQIPSQRSVILQESLLHYPHPHITAFLSKLHTYATLESRTVPQHYPWWKALLQIMIYPTAKWVKAVFWQQGWQDGFPGIIHASLMAYYSLIKRIIWYETFLDRSR